MKTRSNPERGLSLIEVLVATAVLAIAVLISLVLYDAARKSFKKGENVTEQQQATRVAFDRLTSDLRLAGFNYNPDGDSARPDEQIEAAFDTAVTIRADFDAEDATAAASPESTLGGGGATFQSVSTGNDEIVTYVLAKPDGSSTESLSFVADVSENTRDGDVETVTIPNVALTQNNPPYTLYRVSLNNDTSTWGGAAFIVRTPLVENVYSMTFRYYDAAGNALNPFDLAVLTDDIGGAETADKRRERTAIKRVEASIVGLTRSPDMEWRDAADPYAATRAYRKFELKGDVTPRNLGMKGIRDLQDDQTPPSQPATPSLYPGHCDGLYVSWAPNPSADQVVSYRVNYGPASGTIAGTRNTAGTSLFLGGLTTGATTYVTIQAQDAAGNISVKSGESSSSVTNTTTPSAPQNATGTTGLTGAVQVTWNPTTTNTSNVAGDPASPMIRDLAGYRLYRSPTSGFTPDDAANRVANESQIGLSPSPSYIDGGVVNCRDYHYVLKAVDSCGLASAPTSEFAGRAVSTTQPEPPQNVSANPISPGRVRVSWQAVTKDVAGAAIHIDHYNVYRSDSPIDTSTADPSAAGYSLVGTVTDGSVEWVDNGSPTAPSGYAYYYRITAFDDCPNESAPSNPDSADCSFVGNVAMVSPVDGANVVGVVPLRLRADGGVAGDYVRAEFRIVNEADGSVVTPVPTVSGAGPDWVYNWIANPPGFYEITGTVFSANGCSKSSTIHVNAGPYVGCCLGPPNPTISPQLMRCAVQANGKLDCTRVSFDVVNNNCLTSVRIDRMDVTWVDVINSVASQKTKLQSIAMDASSIASFSPNATSPASKVYSEPYPTIGVNRSTANPVVFTYTFDKTTSDYVNSTKVYRQDSMTTLFYFTLLDENGAATAITGTCGPNAANGDVFDDLLVEPNK